VDGAPTSIGGPATASVAAGRNPTIAAAARALDGTRRNDPAASAASADRTGHRMRGAIIIAERQRLLVGRHAAVDVAAGRGSGLGGHFGGRLSRRPPRASG
jgi:hypothetical protein